MKTTSGIATPSHRDTVCHVCTERMYSAARNKIRERVAGWPAGTPFFTTDINTALFAQKENSPRRCSRPRSGWTTWRP